MAACPICFVEIGSSDLAQSQAFYSSCFGWEFTPFGDDYAMFNTGEELGGGISTQIKPSAEGTLLVIKVDSLTAAIAQITEAGGGIVGEIVDIGNEMGYYQYFTDPCGNKLGLWSQTNS